MSRLPVHIEQGYGGKSIEHFPPFRFFKAYVDGNEEQGIQAFVDWYHDRFLVQELWKVEKIEGGMKGGSLHRAVLAAHRDERNVLDADDGSFDPNLVDCAIRQRVRHYFDILVSMQTNGFLYRKGYVRVTRSRYGDVEIINGHHRVAAAHALGIDELQVISSNIDPFDSKADPTSRSETPISDLCGKNIRDGSTDEIKTWISQQRWYQRISVGDGITTPGSVDSLRRLSDLKLPDLRGKSVLDIGCNSGMYSFECERLGASRVVGIDVDTVRLNQAATLKTILGSKAEFLELGLEQAASLGRFDVVLCIAVLHEVPDLIGALLTLKEVAQETIFLEISTWKPPLLRRTPMAKLHHTARGWTILPTRKLIDEMFGDTFSTEYLGRSVRYELIRLVRKGVSPNRIRV
jgi:tRNA (mo5U34)-methyltransferase